MGYRIVYGRKRRRFPWWLLLVPSAGLLWQDCWYEALARYVGAAIYGH